MKNTFLNGSELARLTGMTRQAVSIAAKQGRLFRDPGTGKFDTRHPVNTAFIEQAKAAEAAVKSDTPPEEVPAELRDLYQRKLLAETRRAEAQAKKIGLEVAQKQGTLILKQDVALGFGAFIFGIENYFLILGKRIARGDSELQLRIDKEVSEAITRTKKHAVAEVRRILDIDLGGEDENKNT